MTVPTPAPANPPKLRLHNYYRSSASYRVRIALAYKKVAYEYVPVHLVRDGGGQHSADYRTKNAMEQVPTLEIVRGSEVQRISQSLAIMEYLEDTYPALPMLPQDLYLRARARQYAELINSGIQPLQNISVTNHLKSLGQDEKAWTVHFITKGLAALESSAQSTAGRFLVGDLVSIADMCLAPQMFSARRFGVDTAKFPTLSRVEAECEKLDAFQVSKPERQPDAES